MLKIEDWYLDRRRHVQINYRHVQALCILVYTDCTKLALEGRIQVFVFIIIRDVFN